MRQFLFLSLFSFAIVSAARGAKDVRVDRAPMTFRDAGLYGNLPAIGSHYTKDAENLLPLERAASDESPWAFYIVQYNYTNEKPPAELAQMIRTFAEGGKKLILRLALRNDDRSRFAPEAEQWIAQTLEGINPDWIYAITLDEENIFWNDGSADMTRLYHFVKKRWPDLPVYQWWTPMEVPNARAGKGGWEALPADGWVIDLYCQDREPFEKKLLMALETGKPVIHIAWASPTWEFLGTYGKSDWWERLGKPNLDDQVAVCRSYNVPVAYFCTQPGSETQGILWGWNATDPLVRDYFRSLEIEAMNFRALPATSIGFRSPDQKAFDWAHAWDEPAVQYALDDAGRERVTWTIPLGEAPTQPGGKPILLPPDGRPRLDASVNLAQHSVAPDKQWRLANRQGYAQSAELTFHFQCDRPLADILASADVMAVTALGGSADLALSLDEGKTWTDPSTASRVNAHSSITARSAGPSQQCLIRVRMSAGAGVQTPGAPVQLLKLNLSASPAKETP